MSAAGTDPAVRQGVSVMCVADDGRVLLVRRGKDPYRDHWSLPGGSIEAGEPPAAAAIRELLEETGLTATLVPEPVDRVDLSHIDAATGTATRFQISVFLARAPRGRLRPGDDASDAAWVTLAGLAERAMTPGTADRIRRLLGSETPADPGTDPDPDRSPA